ncbi:MAG TPA: AAA family ATPase, partial [Candidatus Sulfotelmatobacter sp.]|nr:AAA family ATPase [Candidatus Sulfotelmatobacter sp.]
MNGPIDIAVDRSLIPPPLPDLFVLSDLLAAPPPPQLIGGLLHQGCKMILGGISKTNKSWCLLDLAISVASGQPWWGRPCVATPVVYLNFELPPWAIVQRLQALLRARPECAPAAGHLHLWNLRGFNADLTTLRPRLEQGLASYQFGFLIADPVYKLL